MPNECRGAHEPLQLGQPGGWGGAWMVVLQGAGLAPCSDPGPTLARGPGVRWGRLGSSRGFAVQRSSLARISLTLASRTARVKGLARKATSDSSTPWGAMRSAE